MAEGSPLLFLSPTALPLHKQEQSCNACHRHRPSLPSAKATFEPSYPIPTPSNLSAPLLSTTIYHNIPSTPEHLCDDAAAAGDHSPLAHPCDGDGYILAVSFGEDVATQSWVRGRFVRTKAFFVESRQRRRIFRGLYGTAGVVGVDAPVKPKASAAKGVCVYTTNNKQPRVMAFGLRGLPMSLNIDNLVSRGPSTLAGVLTEAAELVKVKSTEMSVPPYDVYISPTTVDDNDDERVNITLGVSRSPSGRIVGAFVCERNADFKVTKRYNMLYLPNACDVTGLVACEQFCIVAVQRITEERGGLFSAVLGTGKQKDAPVIDRKYGTVLYVISRETGAMTTCSVANVVLTKLTSVRVEPGGGSSSSSCVVCLEAIELASSDVKAVTRLSTVMDSKSGRLWSPDSKVTSSHANGYRSNAVRVMLKIEQKNKKISASMTEMRDVKSIDSNADASSSGLLVLDCVTLSNGNKVYKVFNVDDKQSGLVGVYDNEDSQHTTDSAEQQQQQSWFSSQRDERLDGLAVSPDGCFISVLTTNPQNSEDACLLIFDVRSLSDGPVQAITLDSAKFGHIGSSVGSVWAAHSSSWNEEESKKPLKSSYEIFDARDWNDIDSSFTSLGV